MTENKFSIFFKPEITLILLFVLLGNIILAQGKWGHVPKKETLGCGLAYPFVGAEGEYFMCTPFTPCYDPEVRDDYIYDPSFPMKVVKTLFRVIRESDGSNPATTEREIAMQMHHMNKSFLKYGIQFTYEITYIDDSNIRSVSSLAEMVEAMQIYATQTDEFCNIFVGTAPVSLGTTPWWSFNQTPAGHLGIFINEQWHFYPANDASDAEHEMGHALGLLHTFVGYDELGCNHLCSENMDAVGDFVGDFCSDTPPQQRSFDYGFTPTVDSCSDTPFPEIAHINYMSYSENKLEYTAQQVARMHCFLETHPDRTGWLDYSNPEIPYVFEDDFGYSLTEEQALNDMEWVDINSGGVLVQGLGDDNVVGPIDIGFDLHFYGATYNQIYIGSNGYVSFSPIQLNTLASVYPYMFSNIPLPDGNDGFFAPFVADLNFSANGEVRVFSNQQDSLVITFEDVPFYHQTPGYSTSNTFQMIYSALDTSVTYQYLKMDDYYSPPYRRTINPSIIGIESPDGTAGLEVNNFQVPRDSSRIRISLNGNSQVSGTGVELLKKDLTIFPNPSPGAVTIQFDNKIQGGGAINIYSYAGQKISSIYVGNFLVGKNKFIWNGTETQGSSVRAGLYFIQLEINGESIVKPLVIH